jgi:hypothetical protein
LRNFRPPQAREWLLVPPSAACNPRLADLDAVVDHGRVGLDPDADPRVAEDSTASTQHPPSDTMPPRPSQWLDAQLIVMESSFSLKGFRSSVTRTVKVNVPAVVGVPEIVFSRFR